MTRDRFKILWRYFHVFQEEEIAPEDDVSDNDFDNNGDEFLKI